MAKVRIILLKKMLKFQSQGVGVNSNKNNPNPNGKIPIKKNPNSNSERNWNLEFNFWNLIYLIDQFTWRETKLLFETSAEI